LDALTLIAGNHSNDSFTRKYVQTVARMLYGLQNLTNSIAKGGERGVKLSMDNSDTLGVIIAIGLLVFVLGMPFTAFVMFGGVIAMIVGAIVAVIGVALQSEEQ